MFLVVVVIQIYDVLLIIVIWGTGPGRVEFGASLLTGDNFLFPTTRRASEICTFHAGLF
jgi:hypothetical protein